MRDARRPRQDSWRSALARSTCLVASLLMVAGCGRSPDGGGAPTGPVSVSQAQQVTLSSFRVRPLTSVYANRSARFQITVRTSHPQLMPGAFAQVRRLGPAEVGQPPVIARVTIAPTNIRPPDQLSLVVTMKLPAGRSTLGFSVVGTEGAAQLTQSAEGVQADLALQSNEVLFVVTARAAPSPVPRPAPSDPGPTPTAPSPEPSPPSSCWAGCHGPPGGGPPPHGT